MTVMRYFQSIPKSWAQAVQIQSVWRVPLLVRENQTSGEEKVQTLLNAYFLNSIYFVNISALHYFNIGHYRWYESKISFKLFENKCIVCTFYLKGLEIVHGNNCEIKFKYDMPFNPDIYTPYRVTRYIRRLCNKCIYDQVLVCASYIIIYSYYNVQVYCLRMRCIPNFHL
jgi:hypothetical protein